MSCLRARMVRLSIAGLAVATIALAATGCGGGGGGGPVSLKEDPAVDRGCAGAPVAVGQVRAKPVACEGELIPGRLASGRVGDLLLENARVRVIVRKKGDGHYMLGTHGGGIVDAARVGGEDLVKDIQPVVDLHVGAFDEVVITDAGAGGRAEIAVRGRAVKVPILEALIGTRPVAVIIEHRYALAADRDDVELTTRLYAAPDAEGGAPKTVTLMDMLFLGGRVHPFITGRGFTDAGTQPGDFLASDGTTSSYGLVYPLNAGVLQPIRFIDAGSIRIIVGPTLNVGDPGRMRHLVIGDGSIASVTSRGFALQGVATGTVTGSSAPGVDIAFRAADKLAAIARTDAGGRFELTLPAGAYTVRAEASGRVAGADAALTVVAGQTQTVAPVAGPTASLRVTVRDAGGAPLPARLRVLATAGGPAFDEVLTWSGPDGIATLPIQPGSYRVVASRGMEYDFAEANVTLAAGETQAAMLTLTRVVDTAGWLALDTHLHSEMSTDSTIPLEDRLRAVAGEGIEVPISTDHDFITDYLPIVTELGLRPWLAPMIGEEASSVTWGHLNAWPLEKLPEKAGAGAVEWFGRAPGEVFTALRGGDAARVVQVNHPRTGTGLFKSIDFDRVTLKAKKLPASLDLPPTANLDDYSFDALEVANGGEDLDVFEECFADWLALTAAGKSIAATGSSDSHSAGRFAGNARTFVYVGAGNDDPASIDLRRVNDAIRARRVIVSQGAFVTAGIVDPVTAAVSLPGDRVALAGQSQVRIRIKVQAPPWLELLRVRVYDGAAFATEIPLDSSDHAAVRLDREITLPLSPGPHYFIVRVDPAATSTEPAMKTSGPSFTNPLIVE